MTKIDISKVETRLLINNEFVNSVSGKTFNTVNPATEEVICALQEADAADVDKAVSLTTEKWKEVKYEHFTDALEDNSDKCKKYCMLLFS